MMNENGRDKKNCERLNCDLSISAFLHLKRPNVSRGLTEFQNEKLHKLHFHLLNVFYLSRLYDYL